MSELNERIATLEGQKEQIQAELNPLYQQRAEDSCPFKVGDILVDERGRRARLMKIRPGWRGVPSMWGQFLRKDGSEGREGELYGFDGWKEAP